MRLSTTSVLSSFLFFFFFFSSSSPRGAFAGLPGITAAADAAGAAAGCAAGPWLGVPGRAFFAFSLQGQRGGARNLISRS